ncbi:MAG TPA: phosphoenolpyruvate--protein phosphotransferase [Symbiobacteriaceae bacterium]|nr:phosphoenolpyruvate--protein phosphotransferase [Symbiobacteriaceae bacterium]
MEFKGIAASPGIAIGKVFALRAVDAQPVAPSGDPATEQSRFDAALATSRAELGALRERVAKRVGEEEAAVFDAHLMMLDDPSLTDEVAGAIAGGTDAVTATEQVVEAIKAIFASMDDAYMRERAADVADVGRRLVRHLTGTNAPDLGAIAEPSVIIAHDLTPSDTAQLDPATALGFATESGGRTSHSAIMARSLGLPAVVGVPGLLSQINDGDMLIVDGDAGLVLVNPSELTMAAYRDKAAKLAAEREELKALKELPATTTDGHHVEVAANVGTPKDVAPALANGAEGVGLYRTEFLFMDRDALPTEQEQYEAYKAVIAGMEGRPVIIRTLDIGGDKQIPYLEMPAEMNPFLGWRALRMCLDRPDLFKTQLRAIWRAGAHGPTRVMFPMVSSVDQVRQAKALLEEARAELVAEGVAVAERLEVGVMIEIPAAALIADQMAREVDFFSIGSNDLIQYTIAVDRMNQNIAHLYDPYHPGVLRLVGMVIDAAHKHGKWAGMCGEMAGDPAAIPVLLGLGLDEFSMSAGSILRAKRLIRSLSREACAAKAQQALVAATSAEAKALFQE